MVAGFANPVAGHIYAKGETHPAGTFVVVCDFACHMARIPPTQGVDIGNGGCGAPVLAACSGTVSYIRLGTIGATTSDKASIFRIRRPDGYEFGVAHLLIGAGFAVGQAISEGRQIGTVDKIGATACHLHFGVKDPAGVEIDGWPMLSQNQEAFVLAQLESFNPPRKFTLLGGTPAVPVVIAGYSIDLTTGAVKQVKTTSWTKDSSGDALAALSLGGKKYLQMPVGAYLGPYVIDDELHIKLGPVVDPTPYSQADLDAVKKQLDTANNKIAKAKADLA